jgi:hypothetical protein
MEIDETVSDYSAKVNQILSAKGSLPALHSAAEL